MLGFYNYTVLLTYMSLMSAGIGMVFAHDGLFGAALFCLLFSGFCDMFDGKVARTKHDRTDSEKLFGIQLDSLCDVVAFGVFPTFLAYNVGVNGPMGSLVLMFYLVCGVIRLAYFNVLETEAFYEGEHGSGVYHGLPITSVAVAMPLVFVARIWMPETLFPYILMIMLVVLGVLFISPFKFKKPRSMVMFIICGIVFVAFVALLIGTGWWKDLAITILP